MKVGDPATPAAATDLLGFCNQMVATVAADRGIDATIGLLSQRVQAPVAILDTRGNVLAQAPPRMSWPAKDVLRVAQSVLDATTSPRTAEGLQVAPIKFDTHLIAMLCSSSGADSLPVLGLGARIIGMELARLQAMQSGHHELITQLLEDILAGAIPDWDARRRLSRFGVDAEAENHVILGRAADNPRQIMAFPWNLHQLISRQPEPYLRSHVGDRMFLVVPAGDAVDALTQRLLEHLSELGGEAQVGVSGSNPGVSGLRIGYAEALDAVERGPGVHRQEHVNMGSAIIASSLDLPTYELARAVLRPLLDYDDQHGGKLVETLRTFIAHDCATGPASEELFIHRNTLRYRLSLIEKLTDRSITSFTDRVHFWLATALLHERDKY